MGLTKVVGPEPMYEEKIEKPSLLSFFFYILHDPLTSIIDRCTLYTRGCRTKAFRLQYLNYRREHPVNVSIQRTMHLSRVIPANDTRERLFGHRNFPR